MVWESVNIVLLGLRSDNSGGLYDLHHLDWLTVGVVSNLLLLRSKAILLLLGLLLLLSVLHLLGLLHNTHLLNLRLGLSVGEDLAVTDTSTFTMEAWDTVPSALETV